MTRPQGSAPSVATRVVAQLKRDHRRVLREVSRLETSLRGNAGRARSTSHTDVLRLTALLDLQFASHMAAEDEVLYPMLVAAIPLTGVSVETLHEEHRELREMLRRIRQTLAEPKAPAHAESLSVQIHDLADLLRIHIRKEETIVLGAAAHLLRPKEIWEVTKRMRLAGARRGPASSHRTRTKGESR